MMQSDSGQCYCGQLDPANPAGTFQCKQCRRRFHSECLHTPVQSPLRGDAFYNFTCSNCSPDNEEECERAKMAWIQVVMLALYNLQLGGGGKCGYFRWKEHVCAFIDKNWTVFFGLHKKKTTLWHGTIAGVLSTNCPDKFTSGTKELGETGWWKLVEMKPPVFSVDAGNRQGQRGSRHQTSSTASAAPEDQTEVTESKRSRRARPFSLNAAMELKAKRSSVTGSRGGRSGAKMVYAAQLDTSPQEALSNILSQEIPESSVTFSRPVSSSDSVTEHARHTSRVSSDTDSKQPASGVQVSHTLSHQGPEEIMEFIQSESSNLSASCLSSRSSSHADLTWDEDSLASLTASGHSLNTSSQDRETYASFTAGQLLGNEGDDDEDSDFEIDPGSVSLSVLNSNRDLCHSPVMEELLQNIKGDVQADSSPPASKPTPATESAPEDTDVTMDSENPSEEEDDGQTSDEEGTGEDSTEEEGVGVGIGVGKGRAVGKVPVRRRMRMKLLAAQEQERQEERARLSLRPMSLYDESLLLRKLNAGSEVRQGEDGETQLPEWKIEQLQQARNRLRRKLIVRKMKRENGLPEFDLDAHMTQLAMNYWGTPPPPQDLEGLNPYGAPITRHPHGYMRTLDRFLAKLGGADISIQHTSFRTRLVGFEDDQLQPITSPYTMRVLKPFIRRDTESRPLKVRLLQEIIAYPNRNDPDWVLPPPAPIDYCYVQPQHIPSVNMLCSAFFWPGIDLSECLQYPDFSCVVLYKKIVIAFAFMVPDVKHNEAYISFIFTHPEWRNAGIASFMLYHLIQTCMGKDVTLHVSATNPAMLLYQKFGFKAEELCLDFYDKYFPVNSRECKHAFFLRLHR